MTIQIEKGIPLPPAKGCAGAAETLRALEVDDSFVWPLKLRASVQAQFARFKPKRFAIRTIDEEQMRIWRTE